MRMVRSPVSGPKVSSRSLTTCQAARMQSRAKWHILVACDGFGFGSPQTALHRSAKSVSKKEEQDF